MVGVAVRELPIYAVEVHLEEHDLMSLINILDDIRSHLSAHERLLLVNVIDQLEEELGRLL